jgi:hypothetical protein
MQCFQLHLLTFHMPSLIAIRERLSGTCSSSWCSRISSHAGCPSPNTPLLLLPLLPLMLPLLLCGVSQGEVMVRQRHAE